MGKFLGSNLTYALGVVPQTGTIVLEYNLVKIHECYHEKRNDLSVPKMPRANDKISIHL